MPAVELIHGSIKATTVCRVLEDAKQIVIVSAFTTPKGLAEVRKPVLDCAKRQGSITLFLGIDRAGITSSELVRDLGGLLRKTGGRLRIVVLVETGGSFLHAKIFAARKARSAEILVGSFNLTGAGLTSNHEFAARVVGNHGSFFGELTEFVDSIEGTRELTLENIAEVEAALAIRSHEAADPEAAERRRQAAKTRLDRLLGALNGPGKNVVARNSIASSVDELVRSGAFWSYQFDLEKLSVPSGLESLYAQRLLPREKAADGGTARLRLSTAVSARYPLVPPERQRDYSRLAKKLGKAFGACGFETPFGYWVPDIYLRRLQTKAEEVRRSLPSDSELELELEVRRFVGEHHAKLDETAKKILDEATKDGVEHPSGWTDARDPVLGAIKRRASHLTPEEWRGSADENAAREVIRERLVAVKVKLDPELAIGKLRRLRPEILSVPVSVDGDVVVRLLESMVWAVAEDRGQRANRPAVRALTARLPKTRDRFSTLQAASEALLERVEGAEAFFFALFGDPPYWTDDTNEAENDDDEP